MKYIVSILVVQFLLFQAFDVAALAPSKNIIAQMQGVQKIIIVDTGQETGKKEINLFAFFAWLEKVSLAGSATIDKEDNINSNLDSLFADILLDVKEKIADQEQISSDDFRFILQKYDDLFIETSQQKELLSEHFSTFANQRNSLDMPSDNKTLRIVVLWAQVIEWHTMKELAHTLQDATDSFAKNIQEKLEKVKPVGKKALKLCYLVTLLGMVFWIIVFSLNIPVATLGMLVVIVAQLIFVLLVVSTKADNMNDIKTAIISKNKNADPVLSKHKNNALKHIIPYITKQNLSDKKVAVLSQIENEDVLFALAAEGYIPMQDVHKSGEDHINSDEKFTQNTGFLADSAKGIVLFGGGICPAIFGFLQLFGWAATVWIIGVYFLCISILVIGIIYWLNWFIPYFKDTVTALQEVKKKEIPLTPDELIAKFMEHPSFSRKFLPSIFDGDINKMIERLTAGSDEELALCFDYLLVNTQKIMREKEADSRITSRLKFISETSEFQPFNTLNMYDIAVWESLLTKTQQGLANNAKDIHLKTDDSDCVVPVSLAIDAIKSLQTFA